MSDQEWQLLRRPLPTDREEPDEAFDSVGPCYCGAPRQAFFADPGDDVFFCPPRFLYEHIQSIHQSRLSSGDLRGQFNSIDNIYGTGAEIRWKVPGILSLSRSPLNTFRRRAVKINSWASRYLRDACRLRKDFVSYPLSSAFRSLFRLDRIECS